MDPGVRQGGVSRLRKGGTMGLFTVFGQNRKLKEVAEELERLGRAFKQLEMEWDAVQDRVSKVLRRLARERQAEEAAAADRWRLVRGEQTPLTRAPRPPARDRPIRPELPSPATRGDGWA